jgi:hypothetical protein
MTDDGGKLELLRLHRAASDKYVYFLLAASGAAIAFALNQTNDAALSRSQIPLAVAVLCWGLSFFFGCLQLSESARLTHENYQFIRLQRGEHPDFPSDPQLIAEIGKSLRQRVEQSGRYAVWQFLLLIAGALFYMAWHGIEMYLRTV